MGEKVSGPRGRATAHRRLVGLLLAGFLVGGGLASPLVPWTAAAPPSGAVASRSAPVDFLNLTATGALSFVPAQLGVTAGASVHLKILQAADFDHTFTLSPVANYTIPTSDTTAQLNAFFAAHPPLVNLSLGSVALSYHYANFTAPPVGTYEFVCLIPGHFQAGMHGVLVSSAPGAPPSTSSGTPSAGTVLGIGLILVVVVLLAVVFVLISRRRGRAPPSI